jgi:hypothetical protein
MYAPDFRDKLSFTRGIMLKDLMTSFKDKLDKKVLRVSLYSLTCSIRPPQTQDGALALSLLGSLADVPPAICFLPLST